LSYKEEFERNLALEGHGPRLSKTGNGKPIISLQEEGLYLTAELTSSGWNIKIDHFHQPDHPLITYTMRFSTLDQIQTARKTKFLRDAYKAIYYEKAAEYLNQTIRLLEDNAQLFEVEDQEPEYEAKPDNKADRLIQLVENKKVKLFKDQFNEPYAQIPVKTKIKQECIKRGEASEASEAGGVLIPLSYMLNNERVNGVGGINKETASPASPASPLTQIAVNQPKISTENINGEGDLTPRAQFDEPCTPTSTQPNISQTEQENPIQTIVVTSIMQTWPVKSTFFQQWIANLMWEADRTAPKRDHINAAIAVLSAKALSGEAVPLYNRIAPDGSGGLWIDMTNEKWEAIHVTSDGWEITAPPIIFRRYAHQTPLCYPADAGDVSLLFKYVNIGCAENITQHVDEQLLYLVALITSYIPEIPHVGVCIYGGAGHVKTGTQIRTRKLIDPSSTIYNQLPGSNKYVSLIQVITQHYWSVWDNMSDIDGDISDVFCRAITGAAFQLRKLFTDDETFLRAFKRCVNMNGINIPSDRPDLLDRLIVFEAPYVPEQSRKSDTELDFAFEFDAPYILRGILDILVKALQVFPSIELKQLPRMADFTLWGCAVSEALGLDKKYFLNAYKTNILNTKGDAVKGRIVGQLLLDILEEKLPLPSEKKPNPPKSTSFLMKDLHKEIVVEGRLNEINPINLPADPTRLSKEINIISTNLPSLGFVISKKNTKKGVELTFSRLRGSTLDHLSEKTEAYVNVWKVYDLTELL